MREHIVQWRRVARLFGAVWLGYERELEPLGTLSLGLRFKAISVMVLVCVWEEKW